MKYSMQRFFTRQKMQMSMGPATAKDQREKAIRQGYGMFPTILLAGVLFVANAGFMDFITDKGKEKFEKAAYSQNILASERRALLEEAAEKGYGPANFVLGALYDYGTKGDLPEYIKQRVKLDSLFCFDPDGRFYPRQGIGLNLEKQPDGWHVNYFKLNCDEAKERYSKAYKSGLEEAGRAKKEMMRRIENMQMLAKQKNADMAAANTYDGNVFEFTCDAINALNIINDRIEEIFTVRLGDRLTKYVAQALDIEAPTRQKMFNGKLNAQLIELGKGKGFSGHLDGNEFVIDSLIVQTETFKENNMTRCEIVARELANYQVDFAASDACEKIKNGRYMGKDAITCCFRWKNEYLKFSDAEKMVDDRKLVRRLSITGVPPKVFVKKETALTKKAARLAAIDEKRREDEVERLNNSYLKSYIAKHAADGSPLSLFKMHIGDVVDQEMVWAFKIDLGIPDDFEKRSEDALWKSLSDLALKKEARARIDREINYMAGNHGLIGCVFEPPKYLPDYNSVDVIITPISRRVAAISAYLMPQGLQHTEDKIEFKMPSDAVSRAVNFAHGFERAVATALSSEVTEMLSVNYVRTKFEELVGMIEVKCKAKVERRENGGIQKGRGLLGETSMRYKECLATAEVHYSGGIGRYSVRLFIRGEPYTTGGFDTSDRNYGSLCLRVEDPALMKVYHEEIKKARAISELSKKASETELRQNAGKKLLEENADIL